MTSPTSASDPTIHVTAHALARARERHADLRLLPERELLRTICREVGSAIRDNRVARTAPREALTSEAYTKRQKTQRSRFAWNAARSRIYVLKRAGGIHVVLTVLATIHSQE